MSLAAHRESFGKKANQPPPPKGINQSYNDNGTFALRLNESAKKFSIAQFDFNNKPETKLNASTTGEPHEPSPAFTTVENSLRATLEILTKFDRVDSTLIPELRKINELHENIMQLKVINLETLRLDEEKVPFFINLHNLLTIDALIKASKSPKKGNRFNFAKNAVYNVGGMEFSLMEIENIILRNFTYGNGFVGSFISPPKTGNEAKSKFINTTKDPRITFAISYGTVSSPRVRIYHSKDFSSQLDRATKVYLEQHVRVLKDNEIQLPKIMKYFLRDFGKSNKEIGSWVLQFLSESSTSKQLKEIIDKSSNFSIKYEKFHWNFCYIIESKDKINARLVVVTQMMHAAKGVKLTEKKVKGKSYTDVFTGSDVVDWMLHNLPVRSREEAAQFGQKLLEANYIEHAGSGSTFKDDASLYRFSLGGSTEKESERSPDDSLPTGASPSKMKMEDFELMTVVGVGGYGKVVQVKKKDNGKIYAMKMIKKSRIKEGDQRFITYERTALNNNHPFLTHLIGSFRTAEYLVFVMDYLQGGNVFQYMRNHGGVGLPLKCAKLVAAELLIALEYLHSVNIIYRDLKPENILIGQDGHICLTDFGLSKPLENEEDRTKTVAGTLIWMSPEVLQAKPYGTETDWWSFGTLLYMIITGWHPFFADDKWEVAEKISKRDIDLSRCKDKESLDLMQKLIVRDPTKRMTNVADIKKHPFFNKIDWEKLENKKGEAPFKANMAEPEPDAKAKRTPVVTMSPEEMKEQQNAQNLDHPSWAQFSYVNKSIL